MVPPNLNKGCIPKTQWMEISLLKAKEIRYGSRLLFIWYSVRYRMKAVIFPWSTGCWLESRSKAANITLKKILYHIWALWCYLKVVGQVTCIHCSTSVHKYFHSINVIPNHIKMKVDRQKIIINKNMYKFLVKMEGLCYLHVLK